MRRAAFPRSVRPAARREHGAVAIIVALSLAVLIGFAGLALDLGKLYVARTELQNAADSCALAAAQALTGASGNQLDIAEAAGSTTGAMNKVLFQSEGVAVPTENIRYASALSGPYMAKSDAAASATPIKYVECTVQKNGIKNWFIQVLNVLPSTQTPIGDQTVVARAVASVMPSQTTCALPVALCSADITGKPIGTWLEGVVGPDKALTGSFRWVDFSPPSGGASELAATLTGSGVCNLPTAGTPVGQTGAISSLSDDWNSRFGIYKGSVTQPNAARDFTGYAYTEINWPSKFNAYGGSDATSGATNFRDARSGFMNYQGDDATGLKTSGTVSPACNSGTPGANCGDRRLAIAPVVNCGDFASSQTVVVQSWACVLMLHPLNQGAGGKSATGSTRMYVEYRGGADDMSSPCATFGVPGGKSAAGPLVPVLMQ